jgi:hypothetical protein
MCPDPALACSQVANACTRLKENLFAGYERSFRELSFEPIGRPYEVFVEAAQFDRQPAIYGKVPGHKFLNELGLAGTKSKMLTVQIGGHRFLAGLQHLSRNYVPHLLSRGMGMD